MLGDQNDILQVMVDACGTSLLLFKSPYGILYSTKSMQTVYNIILIRCRESPQWLSVLRNTACYVVFSFSFYYYFFIFDCDCNLSKMTLLTNLFNVVFLWHGLIYNNNSWYIWLLLVGLYRCRIAALFIFYNSVLGSKQIVFGRWHLLISCTYVLFHLLITLCNVMLLN